MLKRLICPHCGKTYLAEHGYYCYETECCIDCYSDYLVKCRMGYKMFALRDIFNHLRFDEDKYEFNYFDYTLYCKLNNKDLLSANIFQEYVRTKERQLGEDFILELNMKKMSYYCEEKSIRGNMNDEETDAICRWILEYLENIY